MLHCAFMRSNAWWVVAATLCGCTGEIVSGASGGAEAGADPAHPGARAPLDCSARTVGATPVRRLTQVQYRYSVLDLLGLEALTASEAARLASIPDGAAGAFRGSGDLVDRELVRSYLVLGEELAARAIQVGVLARWECDLSQLTCANQAVTSLAAQAFRRPLDAAEARRLTDLHAERRAAEGAARGLESTLAALLSAAPFLYRLEPVDASLAAGRLVPLDAYAVAARLSYALWSSGPDRELAALAASGRLVEPALLEQQARRMLADARHQRVVADFYERWLHVDRFETQMSPDPAFDALLRSSLAAEPLAFIRHVLGAGDRRLATLLTAPFTYGDARLAAHYGAGSAAADGRIALDPGQRSGLLTQPAVLTRHAGAHPEIFRGLFVRDALLCDRPGPPPANVITDPSVNRMAQLPCSGCHKQLDPIGWGFAEFDALGRFRPGNGQTGGRSEDARLPDSNHLLESDVEGPFRSPAELGRRLARSARTHQCFVTQWLRYAQGRLEAAGDACEIDLLSRRFQERGGDINELLVELVTSEAFRARAVSDVSPDASMRTP